MKKRFDQDNCKTVDCGECEHYYTGACDGRVGRCNSYLPTRRATLHKELRWLRISVTVCAVICLISLVAAVVLR